MKTHFLSLLLFAMILASSCSQEEIVQQQTVSLSDCKFVASFEQNESRTYLEDGKYLRWTANDEVSIFMGKTLNRQFRFTGETGDNSGGFEEASNPGFVTGNNLDNPCHYAIYPYDKGTKITETGVLTVTLPSEQIYAENSFGCGANTMVAVTSSLSDMELSFKNACGYLRFKLYGDDVTIKSVTLQSNGEEKLSGSATLTAANDKNPSTTMSSTASDMITLDCGTGVKIGSTSETATAFWFVVPPTTFESGFTVTIKDVNGNEFVKSTSKKISIERNVIKPISAFKVSTAVPNNQIWYTSSDGNVVTPYRTEFGATITSNTYGNGKGIITFDGDLTSIGGQAFRDCSSLTSITIPNSVISIGDYAFTFCGSLTGVTISNNVTRIGEGSFKNCNSLTSITIPNSVTSIGNYAFNVSSLTRVDVKATTPPTINYDTFNKYKGSDLKIYVPAESLEAYKAANCWKDLNIIEEGSKIIEVDLGLSVKWANCNIGASSPEEYGDYFAWGDTKTKSDFYENNCITYGKDIGQLISYGFVDRDVLKVQYDAATINWGKYWRMPTQKEMQELVDNCTWKWTTQNEVKGCLVTGSNGNSIFLPATGYREFDLPTIYAERYGYYWTSSAYYETPNDYQSYHVVFGWDDYFQNTYYNQSKSNRSYGYTIRPVQE